MTIAHVQDANNNQASVTTTTVTLGAGTTAGNCLVACIGSEAATNPAVSSVTLGGAADNWAQVATHGSGTSPWLIYIYADPNCAGSQTSVAVTVAATAQSLAVVVFEFSGLVTSSPADQVSAGGESTSSTAFDSGTTGTTTQASELYVGMVAAYNTITGPVSPWANVATGTVGGGGRAMAGWQVVSSTGTADYAGSFGAATGYDAIVATLKGAAAAPAVNSGFFQFF